MIQNRVHHVQYRGQPQECILLFISLSGCNTIFPDCSLPKSNQLTIDLSGADTVSAVVCHSNEPETESGCSLSLSLSCTSSVILAVFFLSYSDSHSQTLRCMHTLTKYGWRSLTAFHNLKWGDSLFFAVICI